MRTKPYVDENQHHDQVTGRAVAACFHLVNAPPTHWHTRRQGAAETATFGSEFVVARISTDQINVHPKKRYMMVTTNLWLTVPACLLQPYPRNQHWLLIKKLREAISAGYLQFNWKDAKYNPAHILNKHWEFASVWPLLKPLLCLKGDTSDLTTMTKGHDRISR